MDGSGAASRLRALVRAAVSGRLPNLRNSVCLHVDFDLDVGRWRIAEFLQVVACAEPIPRGGLLNTRNVQHDTTEFAQREAQFRWTPPDVARWRSRTFDGYHRQDGQVGTRNYWLVIPLVFCENRNVEALREAFEEELGYGRPKKYRQLVRSMVERHMRISSASYDSESERATSRERVFPVWMEYAF
jgi:D-galactarate dehydratase / Altronate hydrolase, C terminus